MVQIGYQIILSLHSLYVYSCYCPLPNFSIPGIGLLSSSLPKATGLKSIVNSWHFSWIPSGIHMESILRRMPLVVDRLPLGESFTVPDGAESPSLIERSPNRLRIIGKSIEFISMKMLPREFAFGSYGLHWPLKAQEWSDRESQSRTIVLGSLSLVGQLNHYSSAGRFKVYRWKIPLFIDLILGKPIIGLFWSFIDLIFELETYVFWVY